jgi:hypothetical protein
MSTPYPRGNVVLCGYYVALTYFNRLKRRYVTCCPPRNEDFLKNS